MVVLFTTVMTGRQRYCVCVFRACARVYLWSFSSYSVVNTVNPLTRVPCLYVRVCSVINTEKDQQTPDRRQKLITFRSVQYDVGGVGGAECVPVCVFDDLWGREIACYPVTNSVSVPDKHLFIVIY